MNWTPEFALHFLTAVAISDLIIVVGLIMVGVFGFAALLALSAVVESAIWAYRRISQWVKSANRRTAVD